MQASWAATPSGLAVCRSLTVVGSPGLAVARSAARHNCSSEPLTSGLPAATRWVARRDTGGVPIPPKMTAQERDS